MKIIHFLFMLDIETFNLLFCQLQAWDVAVVIPQLSLLNITGFLWMTMLLLQFALYLLSRECIRLFSLSLSRFPHSHTHSVPTPFLSAWLTIHALMVLCCQCMINSLCLHTHSRKLCYAITQSMLEILSTCTPKGSQILAHSPMTLPPVICTCANQSAAT